MSFSSALATACADSDAASPGEADDCPSENDAFGCADGGKSGGPDDGSALFPPSPAAGSVAVTLHPGPQAAIGRPTLVSFGAPFPAGALADAALLRALDPSGAELKIAASPLLPWRAWPGRSDAGESVRAALVSVEVTFAEAAPLTISLEYGSAPRAALAAPADPRADWVPVADGEYAGGVREPRVYATFPVEWMSDCALRTRTTEVGSDPAWSWFDESLLGYAHTAVNDVPDNIQELVPYESDAEPWLFDRSATLFGVYARTGDVKWLRHAHRSAQFYAAHVDANGYFDLVDGEDLKYSYGRSLLTDFIFTGDPDLLAAIERVASAGAVWDPSYEMSTNFWTERHQTYALLAALTAWEASGEQAHAERVREIADTSFAMAADPLGSWQADGCMLHTMVAHEGDPNQTPICSPWMSALFADAVWEYYIQTGEKKALPFLAGLGRYVANHALYPGGEGIDLTLPWYLASSAGQFTDNGPWGDVEHTCDVAGLLARGAWAEKEQGRDPDPLRAKAQALIEGCEFILKEWHRPGGPTLAEWRLTPARKFSWWFGTTTDLPWLMAATATN